MGEDASEDEGEGVMPRTAEGRRFKKQLDGLVKVTIKARRFIHSYTPMMESELIEELDKALARAGATAAYSDKELASQPCLDLGDGGCMGGECETCAARTRLHREFRSSAR